MFYSPSEPEVVMLVLAGAATQITQITSPSELHNRISECQGSHSLPPLSHWLWSGGTDVRSRGVAMEMGTTVAFREDEAEHRRWLRIRQVKDSRRSQNHQRTRMTNKFRMKCLQATSVSHAGCQ